MEAKVSEDVRVQAWFCGPRAFAQGDVELAGGEVGGLDGLKPFVLPGRCPTPQLLVLVPRQAQRRPAGLFPASESSAVEEWEGKEQQLGGQARENAGGGVRGRGVGAVLLGLALRTAAGSFVIE